MNQCTRGVPLATTYFPFFPRFDLRINMMSDVLTRKHSGQVHIGHFQKIILLLKSEVHYVRMH